MCRMVSALGCSKVEGGRWLLVLLTTVHANLQAMGERARRGTHTGREGMQGRRGRNAMRDYMCTRGFGRCVLGFAIVCVCVCVCVCVPGGWVGWEGPSLVAAQT